MLCLAAIGCGKESSNQEQEKPTSDERIKEILLEFYAATDGPAWDEQPNWAADNSIPLPLWDGVAFIPYGDGDEFIGIELDFRDNGLRGEIPSELFTINNLSSLVLNRNELSGPIPENIGQAKSLANLRLDDNALTGNIPQSLAELKLLQSFSVDGNKMSGKVPEEVVAMPFFCGFDLDQAEGYGLEYPQAVEDLQEKALFKEIYGKLPQPVRDNCGWDGESPLSSTNFADLDQQGHIVALRLRGNYGETASATLPERLLELSHLRYLVMANMGLKSLPDDFGRLSSLEYLNLEGNQFETFPEPLTRMTSLRHLMLRFNSIDSVPDKIEGMSNLRSLLLGSNDLAGGISANLAKIPLRYLEISYPDESENKPETQAEDILKKCPECLRFAYLSYLNIAGELPQQLPSFLPELVELDLSDNNISGNIPESYAEMPHLLEFNLNRNRMSGVVPQAVAESPFFSEWRISRQQEGFGLTVPQTSKSGEAQVSRPAAAQRSASELRSEFLREAAIESGGAKFVGLERNRTE